MAPGPSTLAWPSGGSHAVGGPRARYTPLLTVFLGGLAVSATLFTVSLRHVQHEAQQAAYQEEAVPLTIALGRSIEHALDGLASIGGLYASSGEVDRSQFRSFAGHVLADNRDLRAVGWAPRVPLDSRAAFETAARADGSPGFRIHVRSDGGDEQPAKPGDEYFPIYLIEPHAGHDVLLGLDLASDAVHRRALARARDTGRIVATRAAWRTPNAGAGPTLLALAPVYRKGPVPKTDDEHREALYGFALGTFRIADIMRSAMAHSGVPAMLDLYLIDTGAPAGAAPLYVHSAHGQANRNPSREDLLSDDYHRTTLTVGDRNWSLVFVPSDQFGVFTNPVPWALGSSGLLLTFVLALFLNSLQTRARAIEQAVRDRTAEIFAINKSLKAEIAERQSATRKLNEQHETMQLIHSLAVAGDKAQTAEEAIRACLEEISAFFGWQVGHAYWPSEDNPDEFVSARLWHLAEPDGLDEFVRQSEAATFSAGQGAVGRVIVDRRPLWITDVNEDSGYYRRGVAGASPVKAGFLCPLRAGDRVMAVLEFYTFEAIEGSERLLSVVTQIGAQMGRAVDRIQAARKLRESEAFAHMVADNMPVVIAYFDADMNTRFYNQLGLDWFRCEREDLIGKPIDGIIPELDAEAYRATIRKALAGETQTFDTTHSYPDGKVRDVTISYIPHFAENGVAIGYFCIVQDITERKEFERQLNQAQKMDAIGQLTGGIAHDFNNILMVTDGYTRRALKHLDNREAATAALEEVLKGADRAAHLTRQLLTFSRRQIMEKRVFRVGATIAEIDGLLRKSTGEMCRLDFKNHAGSACVETDPSEFHQALVNLVINARDAMPNGGTVTVSSRLVGLDNRALASRPELPAGRYVEVAVSDEGIGIDEETAVHIFEPFFTTKDQGKGTGLGLAMVYGFAQSSGGMVDVESAPGEGATFKIILPAVNRAPETLVADVAEDHRGRGETVLLVEDDPALLDIVRETLESLNYTVVSACDGFEAIEAEADHEGDIDLLLSDVVMPNMGGFEAAEIIRGARPDIKVVFMSGYPNRAGINNENLPHNCQFLQKPVKPAHLARTLRQELDGATAHV